MHRGSLTIRSRRAVLGALCAATLTGCAAHSMHWPWGHRRAAAPPQPVSELRLEPAQGSTVVATVGGIEQFRERNTLVLDLHNVAHSGAVVLRPGPGRNWPVRLAFRVLPGRFAVLEVRGEERVIFQIPPEGADPIELQLGPGVYSSRTARLELEWGSGQSGGPVR